MILEVKNLNVSLEQKTVLSNVTFSVDTNDFIGIIGPNGGGKSTLIKALLGLIPFSGTVNWNIPLSEIGYLPQFNHHIDKKFPITVEEIILSGTMGSPFQKDKIKCSEKLSQLLEQFNLQNLRKKSVGSLSGGEIQKTLLARSLISSPNLLILDEPTNFIDKQSEISLYELLSKLNNEIPIMIISHDLGVIPNYIKSILCINKTAHFHPSSQITEEVLESYSCPIEMIAHGDIPHRILKSHTK